MSSNVTSRRARNAHAPAPINAATTRAPAAPAASPRGRPFSAQQRGERAQRVGLGEDPHQLRAPVDDREAADAVLRQTARRRPAVADLPLAHEVEASSMPTSSRTATGSRFDPVGDAPARPWLAAPRDAHGASFRHRASPRRGSRPPRGPARGRGRSQPSRPTPNNVETDPRARRPAPPAGAPPRDAARWRPVPLRCLPGPREEIPVFGDCAAQPSCPNLARSAPRRGQGGDVS